MRVIKPEMRKPTRSVADIFSGEVDSFTAVGGEHSTDLRLSEIHFKSGARNRWHTHTTDQILMCTDGDGIIATDAEQYDLTPGVIVLIPKNTQLPTAASRVYYTVAENQSKVRVKVLQGEA